MKLIRLFAACLCIAAVAGLAWAAGDPATGETDYKEMCVSCHGSHGQGGDAPSHLGCDICDDYPALVGKIQEDMPKNSPMSCVGRCSEDTAAYIYVDLNGHSL